ncbi:MAG: CotH kinase family protein [Prevotellaceae bacterium]|jgi:spore coat protein CotH|nr:CotH kinase family protein [Prevotellaceae bacterium]
MKKIFKLATAALIALGGCEKYDDTQLREELRKLQSEQKRIAALQETMNGNVTALQGIVAALQSNDYVTGVTRFEEPAPGGYHIDFTKSPQVTILNGEQGASPQIGAKPDDDGRYCWTLNGEWLLDGSKKIPVTGEQGAPGSDGATPQLRVNPETNKWEVCATGVCADDASWVSTGANATGQQGEQGLQGDAIFAANGVDNSNPAYVELTLADGVTKIKVPKYNEAPRFLFFGFKAEDNPLALVDDVAGTVEDSVIKVLIPYVMISGKTLIPSYAVEGDTVLIGDIPQQSGAGSVDFSLPVRYTVRNRLGGEKRYTVQVSSFTGLPIVFINTKDNAPISSKDSYVDATFKLDGAGAYPDISEVNLTIKGRGNSTWGMPKKPYKMKFKDKISLCGYTAAKEWVLLANYQDPTLIMNSVTFELGHRLGLAYTNHANHVEVFLNGVHLGSYVLTEQIEVKAGRVDIAEKKGFLAELDVYFDEEYQFKTDIIQLPVMIKSPDMDNTSDMDFVKEAMKELEDALFDPEKNFPNNNYQDLVDVNSLINFLLVNEIVSNGELHWPKSTYLYRDKDKKIQWGPLWDFDWGFGYLGSGFNYFASRGILFRQHDNVQSLGSIGQKFFCRFFDDPSFRQQYKNRWNEIKPQLAGMDLYINSLSSKLQKSQLYDLKIWPNSSLLSYSYEIVRMKAWLNERIAYLDTEINKM